MSEKAAECATFITGRWGEVPPVTLILGSGWVSLADACETREVMDFEGVPGFKPTSVEGHQGELRLASIGDHDVLLQSGRIHLYEGYTPYEVTFPVWAYSALGVKTLVMLNAAGGLNPTYTVGNCVVVTDHINLTGVNPLSGIRNDDGRVPFLSGKELYSPGLIEIAISWGKTMGDEFPRGTYVGVAGPSFETPSESSYLRIIGGDVVGMSTVCETLVASYLGMEVLAICAVSNVLLPPAFRIEETHGSVLSAVEGVAKRIGKNLEGLVSGIYQDASGWLA